MSDSFGITPGTLRSVAEANGIENLSVEVSKALAPEVEYRLREIIQEATKFMRHSKREKLTVEDINHALTLRSVESLYGFSASKETLHFSTMVTSTSGAKDVKKFYLEDKEIDFDEGDRAYISIHFRPNWLSTKVINAPLPKCPLDSTISLHWLAIDGIQPNIPQNPSPPSKGIRSSFYFDGRITMIDKKKLNYSE